MAPALNEPMSPTEKLTNSTADVTPLTGSNKDVNDTRLATQSTITDGCNNIERKEKRARRCSISTPIPSSSASILPRLTRSKDAYQRVFEQAVAPTGSVSPATIVKETTNSSTTTKNAATRVFDGENAREGNESMGLGVNLKNKSFDSGSAKNLVSTVLPDVLASEAQQKDAESNFNNNNNTSISSKSKSTEQLLADLTNDIEESITTKVCIRKPVQDPTEEKDVSNPSQGSKDLEIILGGGSGDYIKVQDDLQHMDSGVDSGSGKSENCIGLASKAPAQKGTSATGRKRLSDEVEIRAGSDSAVISPTNSTEELQVEPEIRNVPNQKLESAPRLQILSVDVLPPISTDSTMTASEVEDNLEERLSQLDGTAIASPICEIVNPVTVSDGIGTMPTTPPRTPIKQETHQLQVQQLQQQLQQTPPTPLSQQIHQQQHLQQHHTFTPQSSTSSVNTLNSTNLPPAFMKETGAGELEDQDIEEVLKVLKGFDGSAGADTLCDLNVLFNEEYTLNYEEVSSQPASTSNKPNPLKDMQSEIERNQQAMQRRIDFLLRRMRKIQARYMSKHCSEEIAGLFEWTARISAGKGVTMNNASDLLRTDTAISVIAARPPAANWAEEKNPVASTQMSSMLRRLEHSSTAQQLCMVTANSSLNATSTQLPRKSKKALLQEMQAAAATSTATSAMVSPAERKGEVVVPHYDVNVSEEMAQVAGLLQTEMREVQMAMDSDATESSSGGESADEMVTYNNQIQQPLAIAKRAAWRYSRDRAAIAARWSWLLSQIADLEIKIRQHTELRQEVVRTKGAVVSGLEEQYATIRAGNLKSIEVAANDTTTTSVNGYKGNLLGNTGVKFDTLESEEAGLLGAARTRGFAPSLFRKRKLLQTQSLHTISKKAARPSNIKCGCQWPFNPCALCTGRTDPTAPRDPPDTMMMADRLALLDPGYHPVLSFREDVNSALYLEAIARMPEWQQRIMRCQVKSIAKSVWKAEREAERAAGHNTSKKYNEPVVKRRYTKKKDRLAAEEKNAAAAAAAASATASSMTANASMSSAGGLTADSSANLATGTVVGGGSGGVSRDASAPSANAATTAITTSTSLPACDSGNGTGTLSTSTTTTPLVANISSKNSKKLHHYHLVGDGVLLEPPRPLSPVATNHSSHSLSSHHSQQSGNSTSNYIHQTSDNLPQNCDLYSPSPAHSSLISNNSNGFNSGGGVGGSSGVGGNHKQTNNKYRKSSASSVAGGSVNNSNSSSGNNNNNNTSFYYQNYHLSSHYTNYTSESIDANWDGFATRSRTSSPTHVGGGTNSNYHKYERSKNRTSYDIDNIVIPYSVAASTRVEILQYKEIPTPKWRVIEENRERSGMASDEAIGSSSAAGISEPVDRGKMEIDDCEKVYLESKAPSDDKSANSLGIINGLVVANKEKAEVENATQKCAKLKVIDGNEPAEEEKTLTKKDASAMSTIKVSEQKNNHFLKNYRNNVEEIDSKDILVQNPSAAANSTSEEPVTKKAKTEQTGETQISCESNIDTIEVKPENLENPTSAALEIPKPEANASLKRAKRLKRVSTIQEDSFDIDAEAEAAEPEDITYDAIMLRHERALAEERRKFQTYLKFPWSTRSRANRRIDSRAESSGANTPDPTSPAPQSLGGGDQESIPSPSAPCTPLNPLDSITEAGENGASNPSTNSVATSVNNTNNNDLNKRLERRRTTSTKKERELERRSPTPDARELVPPYEPLQFPLTDEAFEGLLKAMPVEFHYLDFDAKYLEDCNNTGGAVSGSKYSRQRSGWRSDAPGSSRRGKIASTMQNCDVTNNRRQRINNNGGSSARKGVNGGRGRRRGNSARTKINDELLNGVHAGDEEEDDEDDDIDLMMLLAEEADDYDYPKHHLAPDDDLFDGGSGNAGGGVALNGNSRNRIMDIEDEYEAYMGRRHRDSDAETTDSEPFADDDPNDPEWRGESEDRGGGGCERNRRSLR